MAENENEGWRFSFSGRERERSAKEGKKMCQLKGEVRGEMKRVERRQKEEVGTNSFKHLLQPLPLLLLLLLQQQQNSTPATLATLESLSGSEP